MPVSGELYFYVFVLPCLIALASVTTSMSPTTPKKGDSVTLTCTTSPADVATSYRWFRNGQEVIPTITTDVYTINNVQPSSDGSYYCEASNTYGTVTSSASPIALSVQCEFATILNRNRTEPTKRVCSQRRLRSAWASTQSDKSLHCPHEESLGP